MSPKEIIRSLVDGVLESRRGAAGILAAQGKASAQQQQQQAKHLPLLGTNLSKMFGINVQQPTPGTTAGVPQQQAKQTLATIGLSKRMVRSASQYLQKQQPSNPPLQSLQANAPHKGRTPSNKPSWMGKTAKAIGRSALSGHSPLGLATLAGADAILPGSGILVRAVQQHFGDSKEVKEDTSQSGVSGATLYGYHKGFWTVNAGPNQPTVSIPNHRVYGKDGETIIIGKSGMKGKVVKTKKGNSFHSTDDGGPVANPVGKTVIGADYTSRI